MFAYSTRSENEFLGCLTVKSVRKRVSPSRSFHFVTVVKYFDISSVWNVNWWRSVKFDVTSWRNVKFDVCRDVWRDPNFGLTFDGDVWRSTLRISNVVELKHQTQFSLHFIRGFNHCFRIAGIQQINPQFLSCFRLKFLNF